MAKGKKTVFFCQNCGHEESKWLGQCPACKEWNTFVEEKVTVPKAGNASALGPAGGAAPQPVLLTSVDTDDDERIRTGIGELDRVLGGGIVQGSLVLVGPASAGLPEIVGNGEEDPLHLRRGITEADQTAGRPDGDVFRKSLSLVRNQSGTDPEQY